MIAFIKDLFNKLKHARLVTKALAIFSMLLWISLLLLCVIKVNYTVVTPGFASKASDRIIFNEEEFKENKTGQVYTLAVYSSNRVSIFRYMLSSINKKYDVYEYNPKTDLTDLEEQTQGKIMMDLSITKSIIAAYTEASIVNNEIKVAYSFEGMIVESVSHKYGDSQLAAGDIITHVKGVKVESENHFWILFNRNNIENNHIIVTVKRGDINKDLNLYLHSADDGGYYIGFRSEAYYVIDQENTYPTYSITPTSTIGPSGGLLQTLSIYNSLIGEDITKGKVVVGTGTIELSYTNEGLDFIGGAIGAITQKIITAYECNKINNIDVFFVDAADYDDALIAYNSFAKGSFDLVKVEKFSDIIDYFGEVE